jgi:hypothetical protein
MGRDSKRRRKPHPGKARKMHGDIWRKTPPLQSAQGWGTRLL